MSAVSPLRLKYRKQPHAKVAGGRRPFDKALDTSGNSAIFFQYSEIAQSPLAV
jgi:hypothetical protein